MRPALELAVAVAREGRKAVPPVEPPARLRPLLGFARLPAAALDAVRRTLDEDGEFRARVASSADEASVGRAAWLFLHRPEGWEDELARLGEASSSSASAAAEARAERSAERRASASEAAARRSAEELARARAELAAAADALAAERRVRRTAEESIASLERRVAELERERDEAAGRVSSLERERDAAHRRAASAMAELAAMQSASASGSGSSSSSPAEPARFANVRLPVVLPSGVFEDAPEAAEFLVRVPDVVFVVDGYNASLRRWPDVPIAEQRRRLVDALVALAARAGVNVHVVFDGTGDMLRSSSSSLPRLGVQVTFTADAVEADEVILDLVDALPRSRPVVVASNDRRVRREAAARGANLVTQHQLFGLLGS